MIKVNNFMMEACKFITILFLYCLCTAYCYPSRPLNERSPPELTWQAWLLVDDQNQNQNKQQTHSDGGLRRRITPKSVFIAPTFSPDSLPPCAEGYSSDIMGRCIKIIKLDEAAHREFILQKLKEKFGPMDYDEEEESMPTHGPFQINIPLAVDEEDNDDETDIAIILAETTSKRTDEITTVTEPTTTLTNAETSTFLEDLTPITEPITTTDNFLTSTESRSVKRSTTESEETTSNLPEDVAVTTPQPVTTTTTPTTTTEPPNKQTVKLPSYFRFPDEPKGQSTIKFPEYPFQTQIPSSVEEDIVQHDTSDTVRFLNEEPSYKLSDDPPTDSKVVFKDQPHLEVANLDYSNGVHTQLGSPTTNRGFNRRNRDKQSSMFLLPPRWSQPSFQKPLVLRFSRKHAYLDESQFKNPDYYRSVPSDDFEYLFKFKHKQLGHSRKSDNLYIFLDASFTV
ncbi:hypothetical protein NQ317_003922 [Molorchus minor]|uniref:Folded gastrulation N-terminal domain-containing protein n=1 Tax=Molorchus minor TaxID=1323400 RepID=A0ABQ9J085_9CUCU|nr:hypothetical protein NQ317_003922 [Molorchus minor]